MLQFVFAVLVLHWETGYQVAKFIGEEITVFINYAYDGAATVYGDPWLIFHPFAFLGMSTLVYIGSILAILYYYGVTQTASAKMAWLMQRSVDTTGVESLAVTSNVVLNGVRHDRKYFPKVCVHVCIERMSQVDVIFMLRGYMHMLTQSEFHCLLVSTHATIAGFMFGLFVLFGVSTFKQKVF